MYLQFGFEIFWRKDFGAKAAHKILVKLTTGDLFTVDSFPLRMKNIVQAQEKIY